MIACGLISVIFSGIAQIPQSEFCAVPSEVQIHPNESDFNPDGIGRVLISDDQHNYYTGLQSADRSLTILVYLPDRFMGDMVYFTIHDPDDPSDYETDSSPDNSLPDDNLCPAEAYLQYNQTRALQLSIMGPSVPLAINRLVITEKCSGDNYQVLCSLTPPDPVTGEFPPDAVVYSSIVYTAWKRLDIDYYEMYKSGTFAIGKGPMAETLTGVNGLVRKIFINSVNDLGLGEEVINLNKNGTSLNLGPILAIPTNGEYIYVADFDEPIDKYSLIKQVNQNEVYSFDYETSFLKQAYSEDCGGNNVGETFVDYRVHNRSKIPYFSDFTSIELVTIEDLDEKIKPFYNYWINSGINNNKISIVASGGIASDNLFGYNFRQFGNLNLASIFHLERGLNENDHNVQKQETFAHEIGHIFEVGTSPPHVDGNGPAIPNHCNALNCLMGGHSSITTRYDGVTKFDAIPDGCIYDIRLASNPR